MTKDNKNLTKRQHYIPAFHLSYFSLARNISYPRKSKVGLFTKYGDEYKNRLTAVEQIATKNNLYENMGEYPNEMETTFSMLETYPSGLLSDIFKLLKRPAAFYGIELTFDQHSLLASYVNSILLRNPICIESGMTLWRMRSFLQDNFAGSINNETGYNLTEAYPKIWHEMSECEQPFHMILLYSDEYLPLNIDMPVVIPQGTPYAFITVIHPHYALVMMKSDTTQLTEGFTHPVLVMRQSSDTQYTLAHLVSSFAIGAERHTWVVDPDYPENDPLNLSQLGVDEYPNLSLRLDYAEQTFSIPESPFQYAVKAFPLNRTVDNSIVPIMKPVMSEVKHCGSVKHPDDDSMLGMFTIFWVSGKYFLDELRGDSKNFKGMNKSQVINLILDEINSYMYSNLPSEVLYVESGRWGADALAKLEATECQVIWVGLNAKEIVQESRRYGGNVLPDFSYLINANNNQVLPSRLVMDDI